jgi:hypothetical protein
MEDEINYSGYPRGKKRTEYPEKVFDVTKKGRFKSDQGP